MPGIAQPYNIRNAGGDHSETGLAFLIVLLTVLYILTGRLGLELAVPPGYATIFWPPSGIALGMLVAYGWRLWPGILLGSFFLNGYMADAFVMDEGMESLIKLAPPALIAAGSTLQALVGRELVRRFIGLPLNLQNIRDIVTVSILCGPVSCCIAATVGVGALHIFGTVPAENILHNWQSWWLGDVLGVMIFLPLILLLPGRGDKQLKWKGGVLGSIPLLSIAAIILPLGLTFYVWKITAEKVYIETKGEFQAMAQDSENALLYRMDSYGHALVGGLAYFQNVPELSRDGWNNYASVIPLRENYPGINGIGVIYPVPAESRESFVSEARQDAAPYFTVHPETENQTHYVIKYIYPEEDNYEAIGLDIAFEKNRKQAADMARDSGKPAITKKILLVQDNTRSPGFLLLYPVYDETVRLMTPEQRQGALRAWVYAPFVARNFLHDLTAAQGKFFNMRIYDGAEEKPENLIYASGHPGEHKPSYSFKKTLSIMQQQWLVVWDSTAAYELKEASEEPLIILVWGIFFTGIFALFVVILSIRKPETLQYVIREKGYVIPLLIFSISFCGVIYLAKTLQDRETHYAESLFEEKAGQVVSLVSVDAREIILALQRLGDRWTASHGTDVSLWEADARNYINDFSSLKTLAWVDRDNIVQRLIPLAGLEKQIGLNVVDTEEKRLMLEDARRTSSLVVSPPYTLPDASRRIVIYVPVKAQNRHDGFIVGALSPEQFFDDLRSRSELEDYSFNIEYDGEVLYASGNTDAGYIPPSSLRRDFFIGKRKFTLVLSPTKEYLENSSGYLPLAVFGVGLVISALLATTAQAVLVAKLRAQYLGEAIEAAEAANKAKGMFLANMSHEIRTPLNGVLATADLLQRTPLDETQHKYVGIIQSAGALLFNLLNDVLDLSKIEMHKLELHEGPFSVEKTLRFTVDLFLSSARQKGVTLEYKIEPTLPEYIMGDSHRFSQILTNLIGNAVKYTGKGRIDIFASQEKKSGQDYLYVEVRDTGMGIPAEQVKSVFDRFSQAHNLPKISGTGLGLAICKSLVNLMGGEIGVSSLEAHGSTFWFRVPLHPVEAPDAQSAAAQKHKAFKPGECKVLLVEDTEANKIIISDMLTYLGCLVETAENGQVALDLCAENTYDIVFMDCNMPVMDGYTAARKLRELYGKDLPILAISAHAFAQDVERCYEAGMDDYVSKPVKLDELEAMLEKWYGGSTASNSKSKEGNVVSEAVSTQSVLDLSELRSWTQDNPERLVKLMELTLKNANELYRELQRGFENSDTDLIQTSAHSLKSVAAQVGGHRLSKVCLRLEKQEDEWSGPAAKALKDELISEYSYFQKELNKNLTAGGAA